MSNRVTNAPGWARGWLVAAGVYNIAWGAAVVIAPLWFFASAGMEPPRYPAIWQCVGMIVGVYGVGYLAASRDAYRHWPIVLVGMLGKIFGPIGFVLAAGRGELPWTFGWVIVFNDLIWWAPFAMILAGAARAARHNEDEIMKELPAALEAAQDQHGRSLRQLSEESPTLVVLLRHSGCIFCREAMGDLQRTRKSIESAGVRLALVHMGDDSGFEPIAKSYGLDDVARISDPDRRLYRALDLRRGGLTQLFGPRVWIRGLTAMRRGSRVGRLVGDGFQMPGVFLISHGRVVREYRHATAADRPSYEEIACPVPSVAGAASA